MDDRPENLIALEAILVELGENIVRAHTGEDALKRVLERDFAVILLDVRMPGLSGIEVAKLIRARERSRHTPILFLTADDRDELPVEEAYALGAVDYLVKPILPVVLRSKAAFFVSLFRRTREARAAEQSRLEAAVLEQKQLWRTTLASIGDAVIATDLEGRVTFLNPVAEGLTGWSPTEAAGKPLTEVFRIVNETTRLAVENPALRALHTGVIVGLANHTILIARDGVERPIDDSASPIRGEDGVVSGAVLVFRDITERKKAEVAQARLAAIVESSDDAIVGKDLDGTILTWNRGAERVFGYTAAEAVGRSITLVIPPDRLDEEKSILERLSHGERIEHFETVRVRKDGQHIDVSLTVSPVRDAEGRVIGASKVARDVTATKRIARALGAALQAGEVGTYHWDITSDRVTGDRNFASLFGVLSNERASAPVGDFLAILHPDDRERVEAEIRKTLETDAPFRSEYRVTGPNWERWVLARGAVERDARGRAMGWAGVVVDISDRKRAERSLAASRLRLDYAVQASGIGFWSCDLPFDELQWDARVKTHFWLPADARVTIATFYDRIHPDDREPTRVAIEQSVSDRTGYDVHYRTVDPASGTEKWIRAIGRATYDEAGVPQRFDGVTLDVTTQHRAEHRLRESEQRFRSLFESMDEGYCVVEPVYSAEGKAIDYRYLLANPALEHHTGLKGIVGKTALEVMPNHERHWIEAYARVAETGKPFRRTDRVADLGRWYDVSAFQVGAPGDCQVGVLFNDISDRKRAEAMLREKDERLQLLIDRARDYAIVVTDHSGGIVEWAGGAESITGLSAAEVIGRPAHVLFTPADQDAGVPEKEMEQAIREGRAEDKRWHVRKDGSEFFADGVMVPLRDDNGELHGFGKVFRDVTARRRAEEGVRFLADASASLAELVDYQSTLNRIANLAVGGFADWCVVDMIEGDGTRERLTVTRPETTDVTISRLEDNAFRSAEGAMGAVPHVLKTGEPEVVFDIAAIDSVTAPQGPDRLAKLQEIGIKSYLCVPLRSRERIIGGMTFLSTTTRRRFGGEELRIAESLAERVTIAIENAQLYRTLQEQDRRKDEFLATLAHELRNPLAPVRNGVQILRMGGTEGETADRALSMMERQLGHLTHLVDDLMDVARVSSGKVALRKERVHLQAVIDAAVETSRQAMEAAGHHLDVQMPAEPLTLDADRTRLVQVLANLLNNAAKYTPPAGHITLSVSQEGTTVVICVKDTGIGLPAEMLPKVFEMFTQVGTSLERSQGGLGIGLTLVKRLVEMHDGTVFAESPGLGQGSTFTLRLPLALESVRSLSAAGDVGVKASSALLDVLVVDDNRDSADSLTLLLSMRGHRVRTAYDGPEALRLLGSFKPQLVLLDLGLPGMSGYEIARRIRDSADLKDVTLTALTGWGQEEDRRRTREAGFDHHLVKPADAADLDRILAAVQGR